jgi:hypothetical protein
MKVTPMGVVIFMLSASFASYIACNNTDTNKTAHIDQLSIANVAIDPFTSVMPADIKNPADSVEAAAFAWKEFVALTWPAKPNPTPKMSGFYRGQPDNNSKNGATGSGGTVVWETFYHRAELYPGYYGQHTLPNPDTIPVYIYHSVITPASGSVNQNLFNNLDETSEISLAHMYYTPLLAKNNGANAGIFYEAKGNDIIYDYTRKKGYNNLSTRKPALDSAIALITNKSTPPDSATFSLPNGSAEIKATWRHYDAAADNLNNFHWTKGIYYTKDKNGGLVANNDTFLLQSLHIIQKTPNVPTFTFATFEHVTLEKTGFRFINTNPRTDTSAGLPRPLPDSGVITAERQFPIPNYINNYNTAAQAQIRAQFGSSNVWANYQLIGVQAVVQNDPGGVVPAQQFFLSNFATETNNALQFFQGGLAGPFTNVPNPDAAHVFVLDKNTKKYVAYTSGGCLGCHGSQGQYQGGDFSVIAATGNFFVPDVPSPYPINAKVFKQNPNGFPLPHMPAALQALSDPHALPGKKRK